MSKQRDREKAFVAGEGDEYQQATAAPERTPLSGDERESLRAYAESCRTEPDGSQCQWADYTLRLLAEVAVLEQKVELLEGEVKAADDGSGITNVVDQYEARIAALEQEVRRRLEPSERSEYCVKHGRVPHEELAGCIYCEVERLRDAVREWVEAWDRWRIGEGTDHGPDGSDETDAVESRLCKIHAKSEGE